ARLADLRAEVSAALARPDPEETLLQECCDAVVRQLDAAAARVWLSGAAPRGLELRALAGEPLGADDIPLATIAQERRAYIANDVTAHPLIVEDRVVGVMAVFARQELAADALHAVAVVVEAIGRGLE